MEAKSVKRNWKAAAALAVAAAAGLALTVSGNLAVQGTLSAGSVDFSSASSVKPFPQDSGQPCQDGEFRYAMQNGQPSLLMCGANGQKTSMGVSTFNSEEARSKFFRLLFVPAGRLYANSIDDQFLTIGSTPVYFRQAIGLSQTTTPAQAGFNRSCLDIGVNNSSASTFQTTSLTTELGRMRLGTGNYRWYYEIWYARVSEPANSTLRNAGTVRLGMILDSSASFFRLASGNYTLFGQPPSNFGISNPGDGNLHTIRAWTVKGEANKIYAQVDSGPVRTLCSPKGSCDYDYYYASSTNMANISIGASVGSGNQNGAFVYRICHQLYYADLR